MWPLSATALSRIHHASTVKSIYKIKWARRPEMRKRKVLNFNFWTLNLQSWWSLRERERGRLNKYGNILTEEKSFVVWIEKSTDPTSLCARDNWSNKLLIIYFFPCENWNSAHACGWGGKPANHLNWPMYFIQERMRGLKDSFILKGRKVTR